MKELDAETLRHLREGHSFGSDYRIPETAKERERLKRLAWENVERLKAQRNMPLPQTDYVAEPLVAPMRTLFDRIL